MMRLAVVCNEVLYPVNHGGRVDVVRRLRALTGAGVTVAQLVAWAGEDEPLWSAQTLGDKLGIAIGTLAIIPIARSWPARLGRLPRLLTQSLYVATRHLSRKVMDDLVDEAKAAGVNAVMLDGLFGGNVALTLARRLEVPLFYRSQNIEHRYLEDQSRVAKGLRRRLSAWLASRNVAAFERNVMRRAALVFDISIDDMAYWQQQGIAHIHWLPPFCDALPAAANQLEKRDVAFLGNLFMPNNVQGVRWLLEQVWPLVLQKAPQLTLRIAGSKPVAELVAACAQRPSVELVADIAVVADIYEAATVMVNPVLVGSGVNMKSLELLATGKPVVSTSQGVKGLPVEHQALFIVTDTAESFATSIVDALALARRQPEIRASRLPDCYRPAAISVAITLMDEVMAGHRGMPLVVNKENLPQKG